MSVEINMEMPSNCGECPCLRHDCLDGIHACQCNVTHGVRKNLDTKPKWCPLKYSDSKWTAAEEEKMEAIHDIIFRTSASKNYLEECAGKFVEIATILAEDDGDCEEVAEL